MSKHPLDDSELDSAGQEHQADAGGEEDVERQRLLLALLVGVNDICRQRAPPTTSISKVVVSLINQLVFETAGRLAQDLECFAHHAKRKVVNIDDVLLCARRQHFLTQALNKFISEKGFSKAKALKAQPAQGKTSKDVPIEFEECISKTGSNSGPVGVVVLDEDFETTADVEAVTAESMVNTDEPRSNRAPAATSSHSSSSFSVMKRLKKGAHNGSGDEVSFSAVTKTNLWNR